jgi:hypothetical protein
MLLAPQTQAAVESRSPYTRVKSRSAPPTSPSSFPPIDEHLVTPEVTYDEIIRGRKVDAMTALLPHATAQGRLAFLISPHVLPGFVVPTELLTRVTQGSNFATDVCVCQEGDDPATGARYLEEISFEVVNEQSMRDVTEKAEDLILRGVRRVFAVFVKTGAVCEWSKTENKFVPMNQDGVIEDPLFVRPIAVKALFDYALSEDEVVHALNVKNNSAIVALKQHAEQHGHKLGVDEGRKLGVDEGHKRGVDEGVLKGEIKARRETLIDQLGDRFGDVPAEVHARIHAADLAQLRGWLKRVFAAASMDAVFAADPS